MIALIFSGVIVVLYGYLVNSIFCVTLIIFVKILQRDLCDEL